MDSIISIYINFFVKSFAGYLVVWFGMLILFNDTSSIDVCLSTFDIYPKQEFFENIEKLDDKTKFNNKISNSSNYVKSILIFKVIGGIVRGIWNNGFWI